MVGTRLRQARQSRHLSLQDVATRAKISVATLSRIERDKQGLDTEMLVTLSRILKISAHEILESDGDGGKADGVLAARIAALPARERITFWNELASERSKERTRRVTSRRMIDQVDELIAQMECLRAEIESVQKRLRGR